MFVTSSPVDVECAVVDGHVGVESTSDATSSWEDMLLESFSLHTLCCCRSKRSLPKRFRCLQARLDSLRFDGSQVSPQDQARCAPLLSGVDSRSGDGGELLTPSARAVAAAIRRASAASPVEFVQRRDKDAVERSGGPSPDFLRLCAYFTYFFPFLQKAMLLQQSSWQTNIHFIVHFILAD